MVYDRACECLSDANCGMVRFSKGRTSTEQKRLRNSSFSLAPRRLPNPLTKLESSEEEIMKLTLALLALVVAPAIAGVDKCDKQANCIQFSMEEASDPHCGSCTWKICMTITEHDHEGHECAKFDGDLSTHDSDTISHTCKKPDDQCLSPLGFHGLSTEVTDVGLGDVQCQYVAPGTVAEFLLKDGGGCDANDPKTYNLEHDRSATCQKSTELSCTGEGNIGKECIWKVTAPEDCSGTTNDPENPTDPEAPAPIPPEECVVPPPTNLDCESVREVEYDFTDPTQADEWLNGKISSAEHPKLVLDYSTPEISKKFSIPSGTSGATFKFNFYKLSPFTGSQRFYIRVGDYYFDTTSALLLNPGETSLDYFNDFTTTIKRGHVNQNVWQVEVPVDPSLYATGSISLGVRTIGGLDDYVAGVDDITFTLECGDEPTTTTTTTTTTPEPDVTTTTTTIPEPDTTTTTTTTTTSEATTTTTTSTTPPTTTHTPEATTTTTPATTTPKAGGGGGDPHFQRWDRKHDSFHGECDVVMIHSENFHNGAGFDLHARTTIQDYFSYMETAAVRMGDYTMEMHPDHFFLNGVEMKPADLPMTFGDEHKYTVSNHPIEAGKNPKFYQYYKLDLDGKSNLIFKFYKQYLTIAIQGHPVDFSDAIGLLGDYTNGEMLSREGVVMTDFNQLGFEWQVAPEDAHIFMENRSPQLPFEECRMPTASRPARRRLRGSDTALLEQALQACAHVTGSDFDLCTDDVMATSDIGLAAMW
eukprot:scaffold2015_cov186-Amphora_coffeaeformis.AAC.12